MSGTACVERKDNNGVLNNYLWCVKDNVLQFPMSLMRKEKRERKKTSKPMGQEDS